MNKINKGLQGIRGYAILLIFLSHCNFGLNNYGINKTTWFGGLGVSIFIILSGYLLMENHAKDRVDFSPYLKNKIAKFFPLHIVTLIIAIPFAIKSLLSLKPKAWIALLTNTFLLQSWIPISDICFSLNAVSWYLSLTIFFVVISPLVLKFWKLKFINKNKIVLVIIIVASIIIDFFWCTIFKSTSYAHWAIYIFPIIRTVEYMFIGGGIWKLQKSLNISKTGIDIIGIIGIVITIVLLFLSISTNSEYYSVFVWIIPAILLILFSSSNTRISKLIFSNKAIVFMGDISFEFFLIHQLCIRYISVIANKIGINSMVILLIIDFIISLGVTLAWKNIWTNISLKFKQRRKI